MSLFSTSSSGLTLPSFGQQQQQPNQLLLGQQQQQQQTNQLFLGQQPTTSAQQLPVPATRGLGGEGAFGGENAAATKTSKDTCNLPDGLLPLVENFKKFVKDQKTIKDENTQPRFSVQPILEISNDLDDNLRVNLQKLDVILQRNDKSVDTLKKETTALVNDAETAYRAIRSDGLTAAPSAYNIQNQYMMPSNSKYFTTLLSEFETQMTMYSKQIKELEVHLENMNKPHVPQELLLILKKQHETLIALAAEVYAVHEQVNKKVSEESSKNVSKWGSPLRPLTETSVKTVAPLTGTGNYIPVSAALNVPVPASNPTTTSVIFTPQAEPRGLFSSPAFNMNQSNVSFASPASAHDFSTPKAKR